MQTFIASDIHLADAEPVDATRPFWKAFKRAENFVDEDFIRFLRYVDSEATEPVELILNGDIFDFDAVTVLPHKAPYPTRVSWLERIRGLNSEEWKSLFKMGRIIADHQEWFAALSDFVRKGHRLVFVVGNHDLELLWPRVQDLIREALHLDAECQERVLFCEWFYLSGGDAYVSHGHQYDPYCTARNPIDPLIQDVGAPRVRIPFGDLAQRIMLNGMGYFNPHATANFIMSARQYLVFFLRYMIRTQPLLLWTWFWSAMTTALIALWEHLRPPLRDPLSVDDKVRQAAERAQARPSMVRKLSALHVPSACTDPFKIIRELWLDRGLLFLLICYLGFQIIAVFNFIWPLSPWWALALAAMCFPLFLMYSFRVSSAVFVERLLDEERATLIKEITGVRYAVFGHTHKPGETAIGPLRYVNSGFWSPAFAEPECKNRIGTQTYVRLAAPDEDPEGPRDAEIFEWPPHGVEPKPYVRTRLTGEFAPMDVLVQ